MIETRCLRCGCVEPVSPLHPKCACVRAEIDGLKADAIESEWQQENDRLRERVADLEAALRDAIAMLQWSTGAWREEGVPAEELAIARETLRKEMADLWRVLSGEPEAGA